MNEVRIGMVGLGSMAENHVKHFDKLAGGRLAAATDVNPARVRHFADTYGAAGFADPVAMMASGAIDAVMIATPHKLHPPLALAAFERGLHVLTEKPVSVSASDAARMNAAHAKRPQLVYAAMFQQRTDPLYREVKRLITDGRVGRLLRVSWNITTWLRTQAYYDSGSWRATWEGEGGGVLLNQCPHNLDLLCWLVGMPTRVIADIGVGKHHDIEVEDEVSALLQFEGGATGTFTTSTAEFPGVNRLEIVGDRGTVIADPGAASKLVFREVDESVSAFIATTPVAWSTPNVETHDVPLPAGDGAHLNITQNFVNAILHGEPLIAPGEEGLMSLELSNAMLLSGFNDSRPVDLPTDHAAFDRLLSRLIEDAKARA